MYLNSHANLEEVNEKLQNEIEAVKNQRRQAQLEEQEKAEALRLSHWLQDRMYVVMNRVESGGIFRNQNDIKTVVNKKHQFSYLLDGSMRKAIDYKQMERMLVLAYDVMHNNVGDVTDGSLFYHNHYVTPAWSDHYEYMVTIGNHIFYK